MCCTIMQEKGPEGINNAIRSSRWISLGRTASSRTIVRSPGHSCGGSSSRRDVLYFIIQARGSLHYGVHYICRLSSHIENPVAPNITAFLFGPCSAESDPCSLGYSALVCVGVSAAPTFPRSGFLEPISRSHMLLPRVIRR